MFIFVLQLREFFIGQPEIFLFSIASALVWISWVLKVVLSRRYWPWTESLSIGTSVIIPVVDEPVDLFRRVLRLIEEQNPTELIVVINGKRNHALEEVCDEFPGIHCLWTPIAGKRNAVRVGVEASGQPITVLVDSDTIWTSYADDSGVHATLPELVKPFADPTVGGVTTRQRVLEPNRSWITRWADWLENTRALYSMPAQSSLGQVGCLPGRTIAFRREILVRCMKDFMTERFLGVFLEVSDDRTLTNHALKQGYRTVYQHTSMVYTDAPVKLPKLFKQQLRWARGSQYNTLRMLPWMVTRAPMLAYFFIVDIALPFILVGATIGWMYRAFTHTGTNFYQPLLDAYPGHKGILIVVGLMIGSSWVSSLVRQARHLAQKPSDALRMPIFILASTLFLMPVRILGFVRMAHVAGWGTRRGAYTAGEQPSTRRRVMIPAPRRRELATASVGSGTAMLMSMFEPPATMPESALLPAQNDRPMHAVAPSESRSGHGHRLNPLALVPYVLAAAIFAVEALLYV